MSFTTPIYIPLVEGLDLSKESTLGQRELHAAENIDFSVQGEARGRPSRGAEADFVSRVPGGGGSVAYGAPAEFATLGLEPAGLMRLRDGAGERAMLGTRGRLFGLEGAFWRDRGHFACARVETAYTYFRHGANWSAPQRPLVGPDFGRVNPGANDVEVALLNPTTLGYEKTVILGSGPSTMVGGAARCGSTTAALYRAQGSNDLIFVYRLEGGGELFETIIADDCAASDGTNGDAPSLCCDFDQTHFFVAYQTTTANQYKVLRVNTSGSVTHTYANTFTDRLGIWVANSSVAADKVLVAMTSPTSVHVKVLKAADLTDGFTDMTVGSGAGREIVIGVDSDTRAVYAYRDATAQALFINEMDYAGPGAGSTTQLLVYRGGTTAGSRYHTPMHQPVKVGGRLYLTIANALQPRHTSDTTGSAVGTWFTLDLSNVGTFLKPTLVARGPLDGTAHIFGAAGSVPTFQPESAVVWSDASWTFPSREWTTYQALTTDNGDFATGAFDMGKDPVTVVNRVQMSGPRAVAAGPAALFSGSIPRALTGDLCYEAGFPGGRPFVQSARDGGDGTASAGSYTIYVLWAYTDGAGQVHRSAPFGFTQSLDAGDALDMWLENPYFTERPDGQVRIEVYSTGPDPTADSLAYLQATVTPNFAGGATVYKLWSSAASHELALDTEPLYTSKGEMLHFTPGADGGITALGRRVWVATPETVYASLLLQPGKGVTWNDEGALQVDLPAGAGRVLALEGLDDKLVIFCERGVYLTQDGGPDNIGLGPDLAFPVRLSDLGCAGPRSTCTTDRGVVFCSPLDPVDPGRGGPWLLDRSLSLTERKYLGTPALDYLAVSDWVPEVAFSPERQQVYIALPSADAAGNSGVLVVDMRMEKWSTWSLDEGDYGPLRSIDVVRGALWALNDNPAGLTEAPGAITDAYAMRIATSDISSNGADGLGWARVRAVSLLHSQASGNYDLFLTAVQDGTMTLQSGLIDLSAPGPSTSWPTSRLAPEWRLPNQKCSTIRLEATSSDGTARWTAFRLDVQPHPRRAPAKNRI